MLNGDAQGEGGNSDSQSKKVPESTDPKILWNIESALSYYASRVLSISAGFPPCGKKSVTCVFEVVP